MLEIYWWLKIFNSLTKQIYQWIGDHWRVPSCVEKKRFFFWFELASGWKQCNILWIYVERIIDLIWKSIQKFTLYWLYLFISIEIDRSGLNWTLWTIPSSHCPAPALFDGYYFIFECYYALPRPLFARFFFSRTSADLRLSHGNIVELMNR